MRTRKIQMSPAGRPSTPLFESYNRARLLIPAFNKKPRNDLQGGIDLNLNEAAKIFRRNVVQHPLNMTFVINSVVFIFLRVFLYSYSMIVPVTLNVKPPSFLILFANQVSLNSLVALISAGATFYHFPFERSHLSTNTELRCQNGERIQRLTPSDLIGLIDSHSLLNN
jgi:hypothetical protein